MARGTKHPKQLCERVEELVYDALFEGNNGVVSDVDTFGTDFCAAFGDIAEADALRFAQVREPVFGIERMHLQSGGINKKSRADEFTMQVMVAEDMADILAKETLDALAKFLDAIHIALVHAPRAVGSIRSAGLKRLDFLLNAEIPGNVRHQVLHQRKGFHRFNRNRLFQRQLAQARHAHKFRHPVNFRRT